jgi:hypothetical protein
MTDGDASEEYLMSGQRGMVSAFKRNTKSGNSPLKSNSLISALRKLGLTTNLKICLDAGDSTSYRSGQSWRDTSGNGYDAHATPGAPVFKGTVGGLSSEEYFLGNGQDHFTCGTTNEKWINNLHKKNAIFTLAGWIYIETLAQYNGIFGTGATSNSHIGVGFIVASETGLLGARVRNGSGVALGYNGAALSAGRWNFIAWSLKEAAGPFGTFLQVNGTPTSGTSTYDSPSTFAPTFPAQIGALGDGTLPMASGSRIAMFSAWEGTALTQAQVMTLFQSTRARFGA